MYFKFIRGEIKTFLISYFIIFPLFIAIAITNQCVRCIVSVLLLFSKYKLAKETDNWYKVQPDMGTILVVLYCDDDKDWDIFQEQENLRKNMLERTGKDATKTYEKFKHVWCEKFGYGCWRDDSSTFDIARHVRNLNVGGNSISEETLMKDILPPLCNSMPDSYPQWEWLVIPSVFINSIKSPQTVRVLRYHHSYMDGVSAGMLLANLIKFETNESPFVVDPFTCPPLKYRLLKMYYTCIAPLLFPLMIGRGIVAEKAGNIPKDPFSITSYSGKMSLAHSKVIDSSVFRKIKARNSSPCKRDVQSVLINAFKDAVQNACIKRIAGTDEFEIVRMVTTAAVTPIANDKPRNYFLIIPTPFGVNDAAQMSFNFDATAFTIRFCMQWGSSLPMKMALALLGPNGLSPSTYLTNLPFTRMEGALWGNRVTNMSAFVGLYRPMGFAVSVLRYGSSFRFCGTAEERCFDREELQQLVDEMADKIESLASNDNYNVSVISL